MYSIKESLENTIIIKKSKFITKLYKINDTEEINNILDKLKKEYKDSTHICYAYILNGLEKCSDDGEPSGTAGLPILNILKKNNLTNILAVVIRYFGGIKLGAGGLVRAYSNSVNDTLKLTNIIELEEGYLVELEFSYDQVKLVDYMLNNKTIISKEYNDNIIYKFYLNKYELNFIPELEKVATHVLVKDKILIEKKNSD
ncbi:MAG: YigZ family protein [Firmicutes bacterium]|nr:YigZ family protein [Bacillota bacterium]